MLGVVEIDRSFPYKNRKETLNIKEYFKTYICYHEHISPKNELLFYMTEIMCYCIKRYFFTTFVIILIVSTPSPWRFHSILVGKLRCNPEPSI